MGWLLPAAAVILLANCGGVSDYTPETGSNSNLMGNQGGAGVQAPIWSDDPSKKTITNQNAGN
jgi:hypothetical protein